MVMGGGERLWSVVEPADLRISAPFLPDFGADPGFKTPVGAVFSYFRFRVLNLVAVILDTGYGRYLGKVCFLGRDLPQRFGLRRLPEGLSMGKVSGLKSDLPQKPIETDFCFPKSFPTVGSYPHS